MKTELPTPTQSLEYFVLLLNEAFPAETEPCASNLAAKRLGCSQRQIKNWMNLKHQPRLEFFAKTAEIVGHERCTIIAIEKFGPSLGHAISEGLKPLLAR